MPAHVEITIPSAATATPPDGKPYTAYTIACRLPLRTHTVSKRYSNFTSLHAAITSQASGGVAPPYNLPPKHWFSSTLNNPSLTEERRAGLEAYLRGILTDPDSRWRDTAAWRTFLNLPASSQTGGSGSSAARGSLHSALTAPGTDGAIGDPTVWLDTHRELIGMLQNARERLAARNNASGTRAAQEEGAAAKKQLVKAGTLLNGLDRGLRSSGDGDFSAQPRLGEGEMRRRRDLLYAARREKERLEELQANIGRKENVDQDVRGLEQNGGGSVGGRNMDLFKQSNSGSAGGGATTGKRGGFGKGRVIGKETAQTRELDNTGVMQLQKQLIKEQDEDVNALAAAVRRQKELAIQINEELEVQTEMLTMLDDDVERVQGKVGVAKKRVDKIS